MPVSKNNGHKISVSLPSNVNMLGLIDKVIEGLSEYLDLDAEEHNALAIAVIEAGTNAIQHGNQYDESKLVDLAFEIHPGTLTITVKDHGTGFNLEKVESELKDADPLRFRGRGLLIMRELMDRVDFAFTTKGTTVTLAKSVPARGGDGDSS
jgi:serine/threonine-protein kinase RsbW